MSDFQDYRCYHFNNWYFRSIQQGIQADHATTTMALALRRGHYGDLTDEMTDVFYDWCDSPTKVILNGFGSTNMNKYKEIVQTLGMALKLPYAYFREPEAEDCLTSIAIIVPGSIWAMFDSPMYARQFAFGVPDDISLDNIITRMMSVAPGDEEIYKALLYITLKSAPLAT